MSMFKEFFNNLGQDITAVAKEVKFVTPIVADKTAIATAAVNHAVTGGVLVGIAQSAKGTVVTAQYVEQKAIKVARSCGNKMNSINSWLAQQK